MKSDIINVSFSNKLSDLSYPIFVGTNLVSNCEKIIKKFVQNRKVILIHDSFFSSEKHKNHYFNEFVKNLKKYMSSVNLIHCQGYKTKSIYQLNFILEKSLSFEIDRNSLIIAFGVV